MVGAIEQRRDRFATTFAPAGNVTRSSRAAGSDRESSLAGRRQSDGAQRLVDGPLRVTGWRQIERRLANDGRGDRKRSTRRYQLGQRPEEDALDLCAVVSADAFDRRPRPMLVAAALVGPTSAYLALTPRFFVWGLFPVGVYLVAAAATRRNCRALGTALLALNAAFFGWLAVTILG